MSISEITEYELLFELWTDDTVLWCVSGVVQECHCTPLPRSCLVAPSWQKIPSSTGFSISNRRPIQCHFIPCHCYSPQVTANNAWWTGRNYWEMDRHCSGFDEQHLVCISSKWRTLLATNLCLCMLFSSVIRILFCPLQSATAVFLQHIQ